MQTIPKVLVRELVEIIDDLIEHCVIYKWDPLTEDSRKIVEKARELSKKPVKKT